MDVPRVQYAFTPDDVRIAYQDFGDGPAVVLCLAPFTHLEAMWSVRQFRRFFERFAEGQRVLMFDHRGVGMSDGFERAPSLRERTLDVKAVMKAAGLERANLIGFEFGGQLAIGVAAWNPEMVDRMVLVNSRVGESGRARAQELNPDYVGDPTSAESQLSALRSIGEEESPDPWIDASPSLARDPDHQSDRIAYERLVGSRDVWKRQTESILPIDVVDIAPLVQAPTLVAGNHNKLHHIGFARLLHDLIPNSTLVEFEGEDLMYFLDDNWMEITDTHTEFLTGSAARAPVTSRFAVVMFTDLVDATPSALLAGDAGWRQRLDQHNENATKIISAHGGTTIKQTGDGHLAVFDRPDQAVDAAVRLSARMKELGMPLRIGIHSGIIEETSDDVSGAVVNLASRVEQAAEPNTVYVTDTIREMLIGTTHQFEHAGTHELKGFPDPRTLHKAAPGT